MFCGDDYARARFDIKIPSQATYDSGVNHRHCEHEAISFRKIRLLRLAQARLATE